MFLDKTVAMGRPDKILGVHAEFLAWRNQGRVAQVMGHHDARVQRSEVQSGDRLQVVLLHRRKNEGAFELTLRGGGTFRRDQQVVLF